MAKLDDIRSWLNRAKEGNATHMIVVTDTFSWEDYPVFVIAGDDVNTIISRLSNSSMTCVRECYNLLLPLEEQLEEECAFHT